MVGKNVPLRARPRDNSSTPKSTVFQYVIPTGKEDIKVCKKYFLSILKISWSRLYKCLTAEEAFGVLDGRASNAVPPYPDNQTALPDPAADAVALVPANDALPPVEEIVMENKERKICSICP
ncbi:hypothetical protein J6590_098439 [Homalodisca vitripennis]|nr:hypothetical protein J6590_098439 [Homalodisca vitripennis]